MLREKLEEVKEKIGLFGDYDCDGVCASYILSETYGLTPEVFPSRRIGYGVSLYQHDYKHCVIVDCGINEDVDTLFETSFIIDHHVKLSSTCHSDRVTLITPSTVGESEICSAQIAAILADMDNGDIGEGNGIGLEAAVAIACIADNVSITGKWKDIVKSGIKRARETTKQPSIRSVRDMAFRVCPIINAAGRMTSSAAAFEFIKTGKYSKWFELKELDTQRKELTKRAAHSAKLVSIANDIAFFEIEHEYKPVMSILASQFLREMAGVNGVGVGVRVGGKLKGSFRSRNGYDSLSLSNDDITFAGHNRACGFESRRDDVLSTLKFNSTIQERPPTTISFGDLASIREYLLDNEPIALKDLEEYRLEETPRVKSVVKLDKYTQIVNLQDGWKVYGGINVTEKFRVDSINKVLF